MADTAPREESSSVSATVARMRLALTILGLVGLVVFSVETRVATGRISGVHPAPSGTRGGATEIVNVDCVSRSYTDAMIAERRAAFGSTRPIWALPADSPAAVARFRKIAGEEPLAV